MAKVPVYGLSEFKEQGKEGFFYSNRLSVHLEEHQFINTPHKHSTYIAVLFSKGKGEHRIDYRAYPVKPGSVFLLSPGQVHCWKLSADAEGFVFFHTKEFYDSIFINRKLDDFPFFYLDSSEPLVQCTPKEHRAVEELFRQIDEEFSSQQAYYKSQLGSLVDVLYIRLARLYLNRHRKEEKNTSAYLKVRKLQRLIDENFVRKKLPKEYAVLMNMSNRHLTRLCRDTLEKSTSDLINERVLIEAKRLLTHSEHTITEVAELLGYEDTSYFIRFFRKHEGLSPKQFQQKSLVWNK